MGAVFFFGGLILAFFIGVGLLFWGVTTLLGVFKRTKMSEDLH